MNVEERETFNKQEVSQAVFRTVVNSAIIVMDTIPLVAIPASIVEVVNLITVFTRKVGIKIPSLTPNVSGSIFGTGIVGAALDLITLELLPFPSSIFIHGSQILKDIRPIHRYIQENRKLQIFIPITTILYTLSYKIFKDR